MEEIGNVLNINLRQKSGSELPFVSFRQNVNRTEVDVSPGDVPVGFYDLVIQSYDVNSPLVLASTLKEETISIQVIECPLNPDLATSLSFEN